MTAAAGHQRDTEDGDLRQISKESGLWVAAAALCGGKALLQAGLVTGHWCSRPAPSRVICGKTAVLPSLSILLCVMQELYCQAECTI